MKEHIAVEILREKTYVPQAPSVIFFENDTSLSEGGILKQQSARELYNKYRLIVFYRTGRRGRRPLPQRKDEDFSIAEFCR